MSDEAEVLRRRLMEVERVELELERREEERQRQRQRSLRVQSSPGQRTKRGRSMSRQERLQSSNPSPPQR